MEINTVQASGPDPVNGREPAQNHPNTGPVQASKEAAKLNKADRVDLSSTPQEIQTKEINKTEQKQLQVAQEIKHKEEGEEKQLETTQTVKLKQEENIDEKKMAQKNQDKNQEMEEADSATNPPAVYNYGKQLDTAAFTGNNVDKLA